MKKNNIRIYFQIIIINLNYIMINNNNTLILKNMGIYLQYEGQTLHTGDPAFISKS